MIREKAVLEAQALLSRTQKTIKNISYQLGFNEPSRFSKFFKQETHMFNGYADQVASMYTGMDLTTDY